MIKVLVTGVGSLLGQGIVRSLKKSSLDYFIVGTDYFDSAVGLYWVDKAYILPDFLKQSVSHDDWLDLFCKILRENRIDVVLPGLDFEIPLLANYKNYIEVQTCAKIVVSSKKVVDVANDKWKTAEYLKENNFAYPKSSLPENLDNFIKSNHFPFIVKPRFGHTSKNVFLVNNHIELKAALEKCDMPVVQEYLVNDALEFTCGAVYFKNKVKCVICLKRILKNGNTQLAFSENYEDLNKYISKVTRSLKPNGPINFQLRLTNHGPVIFEINPRFSGTTPIRQLFGVNEVEATISSTLNLEKDFKYKIKNGVVIRYFEDQFVSLEEYGNFK